MKERPILFSAEMVRAILDGRKTQTRRVIKMPDAFRTAIDKLGTPVKEAANRYRWFDGKNDAYNMWTNRCHRISSPARRRCPSDCPYGQPGDQLWLRERWRTLANYDGIKPRDLGFGAPIQYYATLDGGNTVFDYGKWRPSIYMCRHMSRIKLLVKDVRVERVQDISEEDAKAEGIVFVDHGQNCCGDQRPGYHIREEAEKGPGYCLGTARFGFANFWNSINEERNYPWEVNDWVWVVEFEVDG